MTHHITLQNKCSSENIPSEQILQRWVDVALTDRIDNSSLCIRIVDEAEMTELNETYRKKQGPTNVLSFPIILPNDITLDEKPLGDIVICVNIIEQEVKEQRKTLEAHWAHMVIHGVLHLIGYDHENDTEADEMESLEINLLAQLGYPDPYGVTQ